MTESDSFFAELQRRHVTRAAVAHVIVAWLFIQFADVVLPYLGFVDEPVRWAFVLSVATLPVTLIIAWFVEHPWHKYTNRRVAVDLAVIGIVAVAAGSWAMKNLPEIAHTRTSIVILPFEHSGSSLEQGLSRAIAYEVNSLLLKSKSIDVIGYESATSPVLSGLGTMAVADRLKVQHVLSGAVAVLDGNMQVNLSLLNRAGEVLWDTVIEESVDKLFAVQEHIAVAIESRLGIGEDTVPVADVAANRCWAPADPDALEKYYTARYYIELRTDTEQSRNEMRQAIRAYVELISQYPRFAAALSGLAWAYQYQATYDHDNALPLPARRETSVALAQKALDLCPTLGEAMHILPNQFDHPNDWIGEHQQLIAFIDMQPDQFESYQRLTRLYWNSGLTGRALVVAEKTYAMNPLSPRAIKNLAAIYQYVERFDEAIALFGLATELGSSGRNFGSIMKGIHDCGLDVDCRMGFIESMMGPMAEPLRAIMTAPANAEQARAPIDAALQLFAMAPRDTINVLNVLACEYEHLGPTLFFELWERNNALGDERAYWFWPNVWLPVCKSIWVEPRFRELANEVGLTEYWREIGFPARLDEATWQAQK